VEKKGRRSNCRTLDVVGGVGMSGRCLGAGGMYGGGGGEFNLSPGLKDARWIEIKKKTGIKNCWQQKKKREERKRREGVKELI